MMAQSNMGAEMETLVISIRLVDRAVPLLWRVKETKGNNGI